MTERIFLRPPSGGFVELDDLDQALAAEGWVWLDLRTPSRQRVEDLGARLGWDRLSLEDVLDDAPLATFTDYGQYLFVVLQALGQLGDRVSTIEVDAFLAEGLLVTIQHGHIPPLESLMDDAVRQANGFEGGPDRMLARLATAVTAPFLRLLDSLEERIEKIEDRAIARDPSVIAEVQVLRSDVTHLRRLVAPQRDVLLALAREGATPLVTRRARQRFADGYEQVVRTVEQLDGARLLLAAALDTYRSTVAEDMNQVMKVLTVFSAIMLPLTLLAGIWGMNFRFMPELDEPWGYGLALGTMALLGLSMWRWFARRGFVGGPRLEQLPKTIGLGLLEMAALPLWGFERAFRSITDDGGDADSEAAGGDDRAEARER